MADESIELQSLELQITGDAKDAKKSLDALIETLNKLENAASGGAGLGKVAKGLEKIKNVNIGLSKVNVKSGKSFGSMISNALKSVVSFESIRRTMTSCIKEAVSYTENVNLFSVSMGEYADEAFAYAKKVEEAMGIDTSEWIRNQGVVMSLATGFGVATDRAAKMSEQLTQLGYDLSSFYNIGVEEAMQKLKSGFAGELEPLRNLGYDLSQAKLEAVALSLGIDKSVSSMNQAEKAELRYYAIMTQLTHVQGDMARTLQDPANQLRILSTQFEMAARSIGNIFIPILNNVLPYLIAAAKVIRIVADAVASLFGYELPEVGDYADTGNEVAEGFEEANEEVAKMKKMLLGIDELNVMSDKSADSGVYNGSGFDFDLPEYDFLNEAVSSRVDDIVESMKEWLGITGDINTWAEFFDTKLGRILKAVGSVGLCIAGWKLAEGFISSIQTLQKILSTPSSSLVLGITLAITGFTIAFDGMEDAIENGLEGFNFAEIVGGGIIGTGGAALLGSKLATWISTAFTGGAVDFAITKAGINLGLGSAGAVGGALAAAGSAVILGLGGMFVGIYDAITNGIDWLSGILIPVGGAAAGAGVAAILTALGTAVAPGVGTLIGLAVGLVTDLIILIVQNWEEISAWCSQACADIGQFFVKLWDDIVSIWNVVSSWFDINVIQPVVGFFSGLWSTVSCFFVNLWSDVTNVFVQASDWFNTNVISPIDDFFKGLWNGISTAASWCWSAIVEFFTPAVEWFSNLFGSVWQTISDIFHNIGVIASGCWEIIKVAWGKVCSWFDTNVIQPVSNFFEQLWTDICTDATNAWNGIVSAFSAIVSWIYQNIVKPVGDFFVNLWNGMQAGAIAAWDGIKSAYAAVTAWIDTNIVQPVGQFFSNLWTGFINGAKSAWEGVKSVFAKAGAFFSDVFKKAWEGVVKIFSIAGNIFVDIKDAIVGAFKTVVNAIITGINKVVALPFNGINSALRWLRDINIFGLTPFSGIKEIGVPQIPLLAEGGVLNSGQLFVSRESGPELVSNIGNRTAVMNNDQIVDSVSQGVYRAVVQAMAQSGGDQVVEAKVNDKVLFEVVVNRNRQETMRKGYNPLMGGA